MAYIFFGLKWVRASRSVLLQVIFLFYLPQRWKLLQRLCSEWDAERIDCSLDLTFGLQTEHWRCFFPVLDVSAGMRTFFTFKLFIYFNIRTVTVILLNRNRWKECRETIFFQMFSPTLGIIPVSWVRFHEHKKSDLFFLFFYYEWSLFSRRYRLMLSIYTRRPVATECRSFKYFFRAGIEPATWSAAQLSHCASCIFTQQWIREYYKINKKTHHTAYTEHITRDSEFGCIINEQSYICSWKIAIQFILLYFFSKLLLYNIIIIGRRLHR